MFDITSDTSVDIAENTPMREKVAVVLGRDKDAGLNGLVRINKLNFIMSFILKPEPTAVTTTDNQLTLFEELYVFS